MNTRRFLTLALLAAIFVAGCADAPETSENHLRPGLTREQLRARFGEPLRIESRGANGEDWYYRFVGWESHPTSTSDSSNAFGQQTTAGSIGMQFNRNDGESPVHLSPEGRVIAPLPEGKVVIN